MTIPNKPAELMSQNCLDRLNMLASVNSAKTYLEIGVCTGGNFIQVDVENKIGVDPYYQFDTSLYSSDSIIFFEETSDSLWKHLSADKKFDLIYLDGLHTFDQTLRDFISSIPFTHENTIWLIDDVMPISFPASLRSARFATILRKIIRSKGTFWMGDVWKIIPFIHDNFPQYSYFTYSPGHAQSVVFKQKRNITKPVFPNLNCLCRSTYWKFKSMDSVFNLAQSDDIYGSLVQIIDG